MLVAGDEHRRVAGGAARLQGVGGSVQGHRGHGDLRAGGEAGLEVVVGRVAGGLAERVTVGVDDEVDEVRVVEGHSGPGEGRLVEGPSGGPLPPQHPAQVAAVCGQGLAAAAGLEQVLVPHGVLDARVERVPLPFDVDDVVAGHRHQPGQALRPQRGRDAGGQAAPVVSGDDRRVEPQGVDQRDQVGSEGGLLSAAEGAGGTEPGGAEAPQVRADHPGAVRGQDRDDLVVGVDVVGEAVRQDDRPAVRRAVLKVGDGQHTGIYMIHEVIPFPARARYAPAARR